jgi:hypothetical protein
MRRHVVKWVGTLVCLALVITFVCSLKWAVTWTSSDLRYGAEFGAGSIRFGWPKCEWVSAAARSSTSSRWEVAEYRNPVSPDWWPRLAQGKMWRRIDIPLWMVFVAVLAPTAFLWWRQRRSTAEALRRLADWCTPTRPQRVTVLLAGGFAVLHAAAVVAAGEIWTRVYHLFPYPTPEDRFFDASTYGFDFLFGTAPFWGWLWARLWVRFRNRLFFAQAAPHCRVCGYNLTGNISGRCPECGTAIEGQ